MAPQNKALGNISPHFPFTLNGVLQLVSALLCLFLSDTYDAFLQDDLLEEEDM